MILFRDVCPSKAASLAVATCSNYLLEKPLLTLRKRLHKSPVI